MPPVTFKNSDEPRFVANVPRRIPVNCLWRIGRKETHHWSGWNETGGIAFRYPLRRDADLLAAGQHNKVLWFTMKQAYDYF
jgi:hypothetical protein